MERLKVYYGWSKLGKVRKKRSLCIMFENDLSCRKERGMRVLNTMMNSVIERYQDVEEAKEGRLQNRIFTKYELFLDENRFTAVFQDCCPLTVKLTGIMPRKN